MRTLFMGTRLLLAYCVLGALLGCTEPNDTPSTEAKNNIANFAEAKELVDRNEMLLQYFIESCESYPNLKRLGIKNGEERLYANSVSISEGYQNTLISARKKLVTISGLDLKCGRRGDIEGNPLVSVSIILHASGLSVSGKMRSVVHFTDFAQNNGLLAENELNMSGYKKIQNTDWYYYKNKS